MGSGPYLAHYRAPYPIGRHYAAQPWATLPAHPVGGQTCFLPRFWVLCAGRTAQQSVSSNLQDILPLKQACPKGPQAVQTVTMDDHDPLDRTDCQATYLPQDYDNQDRTSNPMPSVTLWTGQDILMTGTTLACGVVSCPNTLDIERLLTLPRTATSIPCFIWALPMPFCSHTKPPGSDSSLGTFRTWTLGS